MAYAGQFPATTAALVGATLNVGGAAREAPVLVFYSGTGGTLVYNTADELGRAWLQEFAEAQGVHLVFPIPQAQAWGDWDNHRAGQPYPSLGLRLGEGLALKINDIHAARARVPIRDVKGNRDRFVPLPAATHYSWLN